MKMIMNVLDGAIWHTYFQMKTTHSGSENIKKYINKVKYDRIDFPVKIKDIPKIENLKYINKVKYDRIDFPVKIKDIPKIENLNDDNRFNVYGVTKDQTIYLLYTSDKICDKTCNLLLIENHYVWIKDFNKLMNSQSRNGHRLFFC